MDEGGYDNRKNKLWLCECSCNLHTRKLMNTNQLLSGSSQSCGCLRKEKLFIDLTGEQFGRLTVLSFVKFGSQGAVWECQCECGKVIQRTSQYLKHSQCPSCGCGSQENRSVSAKERQTTHNDSSSRLYKEWLAIKDRCSNASHANYKYYGGKGIKVCDAWKHNYENFRDWAILNGYRDDLTIDRIDSQKDYSPENCRWATPKEQANNRTNNIYAFYNGKLMQLIRIAETTGESYSTVYSRYQRKNQLYGGKHNPIPSNVKVFGK